MSKLPLNLIYLKYFCDAVRHVFEMSKQVFSSIQELEKSLLMDEGTVSGRIEFACMYSFAFARPRFA